MIPSQIKTPLRILKRVIVEWNNARYAKNVVNARSGWSLDDFDFEKTVTQVLSFANSMKTDASGVHFRYSDSCNSASLYASAYACMIYSLAGKIKNIGDTRRQAWLDYFDSHQSCQDGLFYDAAVNNDLFDQADWWGARHLSLHMINAYTDLGGRPRHPFKFLACYHDPNYITDWLDSYDWNGNTIGVGDLDNKIMNIGCLLQYQRDAWHDVSAAKALEWLKTELLKRISSDTGMWGGFNSNFPDQRSRMIQFAYHVLSIFFYDRHFDFQHEKIVDLTLQTQNELGGYGTTLNSSACEDIDSIDILVRLSPFVSEDTNARISRSIKRAFRWVCANQVQDGGFVFRLNESFEYGSKNTASQANHGAMLPTWFRLLSIIYMAKHLSLENVAVITPCPGYEF